MQSWTEKRSQSAFQSTLPARGATLLCYHFSRRKGISIHAPRTGSDEFAKLGGWADINISIHAPRTGSDFRALQLFAGDWQISIHAPRTGSDGAAQALPDAGAGISIHAPRTGSDRSYSGACALRTNFNPRSPHGERRDSKSFASRVWDISIHAPRTGSDVDFDGLNVVLLDFNPRSPHGERLDVANVPNQEEPFQSTLPARGATASRYPMATDTEFQSTLPARGATR